MNRVQRSTARYQPWLILLSGASCSGKTTLAEALQVSLSTRLRPFLHIEADRLLPHLPEDAWPRDDQKLATRISRSLHRAAAAFADQGFDLIVDGILPYGQSEGVADALRVFGSYRLCYVGVHCTLEVLEDRERARPNRANGFARRQYADLHADATYDIEVDTTTVTAQKNAAHIRQYLVERDYHLNQLVTAGGG